MPSERKLKGKMQMSKQKQPNYFLKVQPSIAGTSKITAKKLLMPLLLHSAHFFAVALDITSFITRNSAPFL